MRICRNSAAWLLLQVSVVCGQLPYHALKLLGSNYARTQDAFQKLCRAGYLEVVKAPGREYAGHNGARRPRKWCSQTA